MLDTKLYILSENLSFLLLNKLGKNFLGRGDGYFITMENKKNKLTEKVTFDEMDTSEDPGFIF